MKLSDSACVGESQMLAFTGFPVGMALDFHPVTHRGMVAAITPVALRGITAKQLNLRMISRMRDPVFSAFQLDGTSYPGNSGSPLYYQADATVHGISISLRSSDVGKVKWLWGRYLMTANGSRLKPNCLPPRCRDWATQASFCPQSPKCAGLDNRPPIYCECGFSHMMHWEICPMQI